MAEMPGGAGFGELFARRSLTHGRVLVNQLAILVKVAQMHDIRNVAVEKAAESLMETLKGFFEDQRSFTLYLIGDYFYLEDNRVKYNVEDFSNFEFLAGEFRKRRLGALSFNSALDPAELVGFAGVFLGTDLEAKEPYQELARRLAGAGLSGLSVEEQKAVVAEADVQSSTDAPTMARRAYVRLVLRVRELIEGIMHGQPADTRKLKRAVQAAVDSAYKAEPVLLRLSAIRREEDVLPRHYANVCILCLGIGKRMGLSKYQLARLGMAAALHDIGRHALPEDVVDRALELDVSAMELVRRHPRLGVETLLRLKGLNEVAVSAMIVAYEHHRNLDGSGYPDTVEEKQMGLFSRIVRVADNYDAVTSSGIYGRLPVQPDRALGLMLKRSGQYYDAEALALFSRMMGRYPVGTVVLTSDGLMGVVYAPGREEEGDRPEVLALPGAGPREMWGRVVDLGETDASGGYVRGVASAVGADEAGANVYRYLA